MAKRNVKKRQVEMEAEDNIKLKNAVIVVLVVLVFLGIFYLITVATTKEESSSETEEDVTSIYPEEILVGSSFNRAGSKYLVVYYDKSNSDLSDISNNIYDYRNKEEKLPLYEADMSNIFNKEYETEEETNKNPESAKDIMINGPTLIRFEDKKVAEYIEGKDNIVDYLSK